VETSKFVEKLFKTSTKLSSIISNTIKHVDFIRIERSKIKTNTTTDHNIHKCLVEILESLALINICIVKLINRTSRLVKLVRTEENKNG